METVPECDGTTPNNSTVMSMERAPGPMIDP